MKGKIKPIDEFSSLERGEMYALMTQFYDDVKEEVFYKDFEDKDYCLALYEESGRLVGFTTQKLMELTVEGQVIHGMFSGDTIIHKDYWGDIELFRVWARFWFPFAEQYDEFYWFLICKGYKTYRILPLFFNEFYPNYRTETPEREQKIMDAYAKAIYPEAYNTDSGVMEYPSVKDKLKAGVADIGERELKNKDTAYFVTANPDYKKGNDLVCLARIDKSLLKQGVTRYLFS